MNKWSDTKDCSILADENGRRFVTIQRAGSDKWVWRAFGPPPTTSVIDAGTAPDLDAAKKAAVDALPKPKGLRWEEDAAYDGNHLLGGIATNVAGTGATIYCDVGLTESQARQVIEYAYSLKTGTPADPAPDAGRGQDDAAKWAERMIWKYRDGQEWIVGPAPHGGTVVEWSMPHSPKLARAALAESVRAFVAEQVKADREKRDAKLFKAMERHGYGVRFTSVQVWQLLAAIDAE